MTVQQLAAGLQQAAKLADAADQAGPEFDAVKTAAQALADTITAALPQKADGTAYSDAELHELAVANDDEAAAILARHASDGA